MSASSLVGREYELGQLGFAVEGARRRRTQLVEIVGDGGIGKSRLIEELPRLAPGFFHHAARCERSRTSEAYFPLRSLLRNVAGIRESADSADAGRLLRRWVESVTPELLPMLRLLEAPFGADTRGRGGPGVSDPSRRRNLMSTVVEALLSRTLTTPTLLVFEDTQWMDEASRSLLDALVNSATAKPWLVCVTRRPEGESIISRASRTVIVLRPLGPQQAMALARAVPESGLDPADRERIVARSGGNPLFIRELVAAGHMPGQALPASVEVVLREQLDSLGRGDQLVLGYAAAMGRRFDLRLLRRLIARTELRIDLDRRITALSPFLIEVEPDRLVFRDDLMRETAYAQLDVVERRDIHGRIAAAIESQAGDTAEEFAAKLALHFNGAGEWQRAWRYAVVAGRAAQTRYANMAAAELYGLALAVPGSAEIAPAAEVAEVRESLGDVLAAAGRYERADTEFQQAEPLVRDSTVARARMIRKRGRCAEKLGQYDDASAVLNRALQVIPDPPRSCDEGRERAEIEVGRGSVALRQGRFDIAVSCCERAIDCVNRFQGDRQVLAHAYLLRETAQECLPGGARSDAYRLKALAIYEESGDIAGWTNVANSLGAFEYFAGGWGEALRFYRSATKVNRRIGEIDALAGTLVNEGEILSNQGHFPEALALFGEALILFEGSRSKLGLAVTTRNLGRLAARTGRTIDAEQTLRRAVADLEDAGSDDFVKEAKAYLAEALILGGEHRQAYELATRTIRTIGGCRSRGLRALLERVAGYAAFQNFEPDVAADHFRSSLVAADKDGAVFEQALTLTATAELAERTGLEEPGILRAEAQEILGRLGVVALPSMPLPETFFEPREHRL